MSGKAINAIRTIIKNILIPPASSISYFNLSFASIIFFFNIIYLYVVSISCSTILQFFYEFVEI